MTSGRKRSVCGRFGLRFLMMLVASGSLAAPAIAAEPPAIRSFPLTVVQRLGAEMARRDAAAWVATDALRERVPDLQAAGLRGWVTTDVGAGQRVHFVRDLGEGVEAGFDVLVSSDLKTVFSEPTDRRLTPDERAQLDALNTAAKALAGQPVCRPGYNNVVLRDPEGEGWLVWLLAPMTEVGTIPVGGHYRVSVTADGRTVTHRDALSASCITVPKPDPAQGELAAVFVTHVVSPTPVETHVFLQLQARKAMLVAAGDHIWSIVDGRIEDRGLLKDLGKGAPPR